MKYFVEKVDFDISLPLSPPLEAICTSCIKCESPFSRNIKKHIMNLPSADFIQRVVKVKGHCGIKCVVLILYNATWNRVSLDRII